LQIQEKPNLKSEEKAVDDGSSSDGVTDGGDSHTNNGRVLYGEGMFSNQATSLQKL